MSYVRIQVSNDSSFKICGVCDGTGRERCFRCGGYGTFTSGETCYYCQGEGTITCKVCDGYGYHD